PASGRVGEARRSPRVVGTRHSRLRTVSAAVVQKAAVAPSAPDDHLAPGPYCCVKFSATWCAGAVGGCPTIGAGIISAPGIEIGSAAESAPDDHLTSGPHCRVSFSSTRRAGRGGGCPTVGAGIISSAGVLKAAAVLSAPDDHFAASPHCRWK